MQLQENNLMLEPNEKDIYLLFGKRCMDLLASLFLLIILAPLFLLVGIAIKLSSEGPIIYKQKRVGKDIKEFYIFKFRTMVVDADKIGSTSTTVGDTRITKTGSLLRKLSLDELPQLFNVIKGDMSIVGYRPGVEGDYSEQDLSSIIFSLKPGITGYAQVNGRSSITVEKKAYWERKYTQEVSFKTDILILIKTVKVVLLRKDIA